MLVVTSVETCTVWGESAVGSESGVKADMDQQCGRPIYAWVIENEDDVPAACCKACTEVYVNHFDGVITDYYAPSEEDVAAAIASIRSVTLRVLAPAIS